METSMRPRRTYGPFDVLSAVLFAAAVAGCVSRQVAPPATRPVPAPLLGRPFGIATTESSLIVLVYRSGPLAALGHNHIVSCRCVSGTVYLPRDPSSAGFDLHIAVNDLTVDDPALRAAEHSAEFPPDVPRSARRGTRHNMLGPALLDVAKYPDITLRSAGLRPSSDGRPGDIVAQVLVGLDGAVHSLAVPMHYEIRPGEIVASGEFPLKQTDLGLTPFSAMAGALRVRDGMTVRIRLVARRPHDASRSSSADNGGLIVGSTTNRG
jgi:YceI-like domain